MRKWLLFVLGVMAWARPCPAQTNPEQTTEGLVRVCDVAVKYPTLDAAKKAPADEQVAIASDGAYCRGFFSALVGLNRLLTPVFCPPKTQPLEEAIKIFLVYAKSNPKFASVNGTSIALSSLADVYPCQ